MRGRDESRQTYAARGAPRRSEPRAISQPLKKSTGTGPICPWRDTRLLGNRSVRTAVWTQRAPSDNTLRVAVFTASCDLRHKGGPKGRLNVEESSESRRAKTPKVSLPGVLRERVTPYVTTTSQEKGQTLFAKRGPSPFCGSYRKDAASCDLCQKSEPVQTSFEPLRIFPGGSHKDTQSESFRRSS